jgi:hypothetical protein
MGDNIDSIVFGFRGQINFNAGHKDSTEIDMALNGSFCEAKLTETDFTNKPADIVERYDDLNTYFHTEALPRIGRNYDNYQIIRNILAACQHGRQHLLLCDKRRSDLILRYKKTVDCLVDMQSRVNCRVVFWQELAAACDVSLRNWLNEKYGIK